MEYFLEWIILLINDDNVGPTHNNRVHLRKIIEEEKFLFKLLFFVLGETLSA